MRLTTLRADALAYCGIDPCMIDNYSKSFVEKCVKTFKKEMSE